MAEDSRKTATFRKRELADRGLLIAHLRSSPGAIAEGFSFLPARELPGEEFLLGMNAEKRLYIVEPVSRFEDGLLYRSLAHLSWTMNNVLTWGRDSGPLPVDQQLMPGIIYIVPDAPPAFTGAFEFISDTVSLAVIRYWYLESALEHGFYLEPLLVREKGGRGKTSSLPDIQIASLREQAGLTQEEIMKFLS
jgi:hypothetical protein